MRNVSSISISLLTMSVALGVWAFAPERVAAEGIEGKWKAVAIERGGQRLPEEILKQFGDQMDFEGGKMRRRVGDKVVFEADFKVDASKTPKTYEMHGGKDKKGRDVVIRGIYEIDDKGQLRICFNSGPNAVAPKSFDTKANPSAQMTIYERVK